MKALVSVAVSVAALAVAAGSVVSATAAGSATPNAVLASSPTSVATTPCTAGTQVETKSGPVCGVTAAGVTSYLGIHYAAPPVGDLRWRPPAPAAPWTSTFQATAAGNICPGPSTTGGPVTGSEDCLTLNVQSPADAGTSPLPVMVEIHGGGSWTRSARLTGPIWFPPATSCM